MRPAGVLGQAAGVMTRATFKARNARLVGAGLDPPSIHKLRPDSVGTALEGGTRSRAGVLDRASRSYFFQREVIAFLTAASVPGPSAKRMSDLESRKRAAAQSRQPPAAEGFLASRA